MSTSFGLTSLREDKNRPSPQLSLSDKDKQKIAEVQAEIDYLERVKKNLEDETKKLTHTTEVIAKEHTRSHTEVKRFKIQRNILLKQIKELLLALDMIQGRESGFISAIVDFEKGRIGDLSSISGDIFRQLDKFRSDLTQKSQDLTKTEQFLLEFSQYYAELAQICEAETSQNALERMELEKGLKDTDILQKSLESAHKLVDDRLLRVERLFEVADERFQTADSLASYFENMADEERKALDKARGDILLKEKSIAAERKELERREYRISIQLRHIRGREKAIEAIVNNLRKRGIVV